jgi:hypothetical protein
MTSLARVPLLDDDALSLATAERPRVVAILDAADRHYGRPLLKIGDRVSRAWAARHRLAARDRIAAIAAVVGRPGAWMLNLSFEWTCSNGLRDGADGRPELARVLDWPLPTLGAQVVVRRRSGPAGPVLDVGWPGFVGTVQGLAPGRFALAMNQPPRPTVGAGETLDRWVALVGRWRRGGMPPALLLRRVLDFAPDFAAARRMLIETPLASPAILSLVGVRPGEACVVERSTDRAAVFDGPIAATNHWRDPGFTGVPARTRTDERLAAMTAHVGRPLHGFDWLSPPVLNPTTRVAMYAHPASGRLIVQGWEAHGPATLPTDIA